MSDHLEDQPAGTGWSHYLAKPRAPRHHGKGKGKGKGAAAAAAAAASAAAAAPSPHRMVPHTANAALEAFYEEQRVAPTDQEGATLTRTCSSPARSPENPNLVGAGVGSLGGVGLLPAQGALSTAP